MKMRFQLGGMPVPKGRPRFTRSGRTYTPKPTLDYEAQVAERCRIALALCGAKAAEGPVLLQLDVFFPIPQSAKRKRVPDKIVEDQPYTQRPDMDNVLKAVMDGLNGVAWVDDAQVYGVIARKLYSDNPRIQVTMEWEEAGGHAKPTQGESLLS